MTDNTKMREAFERHAYCWAASFTAVDGEYCDDEVNSAWLYFKAGAAWQAAQSVAVVGEPVAYVNADALRRWESSQKDNWSGALLTAKPVPGSDVPLYLAPAHSIPAAELDALRDSLASAERELETERMRLGACGVIALANTVESAKNARDMLPEYWSASAQDCASAVDREMEYRTRLAQEKGE